MREKKGNKGRGGIRTEEKMLDASGTRALDSKG